MDWLKPYLIARVRVQALRAQVEAGGEVKAWQLMRAIEPVVGDLLPLPDRPLPDQEDRAEARRRQLGLENEAARRAFMDSSCCG